MIKPKLLILSREVPRCSCHQSVFNSEYEITVTGSEEDFVEKSGSEEFSAAVVCLCSAREEETEDFLRLAALTGPLPTLACSRTLDSGFVAAAAREGVNQFLCCTMEGEKIRGLTREAINREGLKHWLESHYPGALETSPYMLRFISKIVRTFPHRLQLGETAGWLGISRRWLQKLCRQAFGVSFTRLMRRLYLHQALRMIRYTGLDNSEIALHLNYSEESSLARDFRKELGCTPNEARQRLSGNTPEELLHESMK